MRRVTLAILIGIGGVSAGGVVAHANLKSHVVGPTLSAQEAEKKWGSRIFDSALFKEASIEERAKMASDLLRKKQMKGLAMAVVRERLGEHTGYFWNDQIPAYLLNEGWKNDEDVWQLVLLPGRDGKVGDIVINKNCCDKSHAGEGTAK